MNPPFRTNRDVSRPDPGAPRCSEERRSPDFLPRARGLAAAVAVLALAAGLSLGSSEGRAEQPPNRYNGASYGPEVFAGFGSATLSDAQEASIAVGFRHSFPFLLGDSRLSYTLESPSTALNRPDRHGLWLHTGLHPLAPAILGSEWMHYVLGSPYFEAGVGGLIYSPEFSADVASPAVGWSIGAGLDVPLADPDQGEAPWLHLLYRFRNDATNDTSAAGRSRVNALYLGFSWRFNGTLP